MMRLTIALIVAMAALFIKTLTAQAQSDKCNISGTVTEAKSGEYITGIAVAVYPPDTSESARPLRGAYTNKFGFYSIPSLGSGSYRLVVTGIGYARYDKLISLKNGENLTVNIAMETKDAQTEEVVVKGEKAINNTENISKVEINPSMVTKMPSLGEADVFRTLQLLPGVKQSTELSSGLYVRGGSPDQNLTLLDGVIVYNPSHLGGFLSTFNSEALRDIKLIKGAFPAEYGGRLSSVLDMTMKEGTKEKFTGSGGISLISARATVEGPIGEDVTFMVSGRRMYLDILTNMAFDDEDEVPGYYFYDLNAKINYKISDNDRIFASGFFGRDVLETPEAVEETMGIYWGNKTGNLRWMHIISPVLFSNFSLIYTDYSFNVNLSDDESKQTFDVNSGTQDITVRGDMQYFPSGDHTIKTGFETTWHRFKANAVSSMDYLEDEPLPSNTIKSLDAAFFVQDEWKITPLLASNIGCRLYYFENGNYLNLEPRLSLSYAVSSDVSVNAALAVANQYLHLLVRNDITLPTDLWFPSTKTVKPSRSVQGSLGMEAQFYEGEYLFTTEVYYKSMSNIYEYKDNAEFSFWVPLEDQFVKGMGEAYGIELFLNKRIGNFTGWIGYTLAWTRRKFDALNDGKWFSPRYDRRHDISVVLTFKFSETWEFSAAWVYGTGQAYTMPTGVYSMPVDDDDTYTYEFYRFTERNGYRLPSSHRLDVNIANNTQIFGIDSQIYLSIYNLYNRHNPFAWYISDEWDEDGSNSRKVVKQITLFPIIPTFGINFNF